MNKERKQLMKTYKPMLRVLAVVLASMATATAADAPKLRFNFTKSNVPGALQTFPSGINNAGVTVGQYQDSSGKYYGYILKGKKLTPLNDPNGTNTFANQINYNEKYGEMVVGGYTSNSTGNYVGFLYNAKTKTFTDIPGPTGATASIANGVNDKGEIAGQYLVSGAYHGFLLQGKKYTTLDVPGAQNSLAYAINNKGWIEVDTYNSGTRTWSTFLTKNTGKTYPPINVPGAGPLGSSGDGLNNEGDVTFYWYDSNGLEHGALCTMCGSKSRKYYKFNYPGAYTTFAGAPNDKNTLVGGYNDTNGGPESGFIATWTLADEK
jgi:hypothetical protein